MCFFFLIIRRPPRSTRTDPLCPYTTLYRSGLQDLPIVVFTGKELSDDEDQRLRKAAKSVVIKGVESPERLLDETALFLHRVVADLPPAKRRMVQQQIGRAHV